jgi:hypothetical protein
LFWVAQCLLLFGVAGYKYIPTTSRIIFFWGSQGYPSYMKGYASSMRRKTITRRLLPSYQILSSFYFLLPSFFKTAFHFSFSLMQVDVAIDVVDKMCEAGFTLSSHVMQSVLETCSETDQHFRVLYILRKPASLFFYSSSSLSLSQLDSNQFLRTICCVG